MQNNKNFIFLVLKSPFNFCSSHQACLHKFFCGLECHLHKDMKTINCQ
uniref:Uncharacterized protein n=1 Tax=Rhizophora mucronata TaxID=61149 RepID=A0A2P2NGQ6_RHIMU